MDKLRINLLKPALLFVFTLALIQSPWVSISDEVSDAQAQSNANLAEGNDFATLVLRDPWDMDQFFDVSQHINGDGQFDLVKDISVENSVFSAKSTSARDAHFFVLFPGFYDTVAPGKTGANYPIPSSKYNCLYTALKVDSRAADGWGPDQFQVFWFADGSMNGGNAPWGASSTTILYPEAAAGTPETYWKLVSIDLSKTNTLVGSKWNDQPVWRGLRIDPTLQADVDFSIDWVRLTDCQANNFEVTWTPVSGTYALWVRPEGTTRDIRVATNITGGSGKFTVDTQGLAPGPYKFGLGTNADCCTTWGKSDLVINAMPVARFARPSFTSGPAYYPHDNASWNFSSDSDVTKVVNTSAKFQDGVLDLVTETGPLPGGKDAQVHITTPQAFNGNQYRYLTFRYYTEGAWQRFGGGMVIRWVWSTPGASGKPDAQCYLVSQDITHDVGWQTFTVDLFDSYNGSVEQTTGDCPGGSLSWSGSKNISSLRFDPNENIMGYPLHQQVDWISLNQMDMVVKGQAFPIQISLNKSPQEIKKVTFYYTDDLSQPTKFPAEAFSQATFTGASPQSGQAQFAVNSRIFLPMSLRNYSDLKFTPLPNGVNFGWNTASVSPGEYHVCAVVEDSYNQATYCSEAAMQVIAP